MKQIIISKDYFHKPGRFNNCSNSFIRDYTVLLLHKSVYGRSNSTKKEKQDLIDILPEYERRFKKNK